MLELRTESILWENVWIFYEIYPRTSFPSEITIYKFLDTKLNQWGNEILPMDFYECLSVEISNYTQN